MFLSDTSIDRPVLTTVVTAAVLLLGWIGYRNLPVRELPDVEFPVVSVRTVLPGASPEVVETEVTEVLEEEINTIEGLKTLTSASGEATSYVIAEFELGRDVDFALQDVRAQVSRVRGELPDDVEEPVIQKQDPDARPIMWIAVRGPDVPLTEVNEVADNVVRERLQTLEGVGSVLTGGGQRFAVRIRLDPKRMAAYAVTVGDVRRALQQGNVEIPSGRLESDSREFTVRTEGEFETPEAFNELIVAYRDGSPVRLGDVGIAEGGAENERTLARFNGEPTVGLGVVKQSGANTVAVADRVLEELERIREVELPPGYTLSLATDDSEFIEQSLAEVEETLLLAFVLVVLVILLFLRNVRATIIPSLAIPVSIVGTFGAIYALGFSINTLTLLALVLAIGIVVDDAIVVVENIYRHMEEGEGPKEAARNGTAEIAFAVIAISLTLVIVFLPIALMGGITGRLFRQFGVAVAVSVLISAFVALTLTPMLASRFLKPGSESNRRVFRVVENGVARLTRWYRGVLDRALGRRGLVMLVAGAALVVSVGVMSVMGREFVPQEDRGEFLVSIEGPEGATLSYTDHYLRRLEGILAETEGVDRYFTAIGLGFGGPPSVSSAIAFVKLEERDERRGQFEIIGEVRREASELAGVNVFVFSPSALSQGFGRPLQFVVQSEDLDRLAARTEELVSWGRRQPWLVGVDTDVDLNKPEVSVTIDRNKAASLGVSVADVAGTLQVLLGGQDLSEFERGAERYEVIAQVRDTLRATPQDLSSLYVRGEGGELVQLASVVRVQEGVGPNQINHYDRRRSITIGADVEGVSLGDAIERMEERAAEVLPADFTTAVAGQSQDFQESFASLMFALLMAVIAIYLVLAGQFESFVHPFTIMLALPLALVGAVLGLGALGMTLNIYSMIGIIMLMGLVTKNSILLVDFANQARRGGMERDDAVVRAGEVRLRPILMTAISVVIGVMPIALALGAGAESRRPLGVAVVCGMITATALTLFVVPVFYTLLDDGLQWAGARLRSVGVLGGGTEEGAAAGST